LTPIAIEEPPPNEFFFNKKTKVVVKQELYQEAGTVSKKYKILTDGKDMKKSRIRDANSRNIGCFHYEESIFSWDPKGSTKTKESFDQETRG
jgi:hypothetical protein